MIFIGFQATFAIITVGADQRRGRRTRPVRTLAALRRPLGHARLAPIAHWVWGGGLRASGIIGSRISALDFAGGTVVHMNAGIAGLMLAVVWASGSAS